jgi:hypothetical protein
MKKRIAILGCSHTDWQQGSRARRGWVEQLAVQFPDVEFHNFARMGHGSLWFDFVLKHLIANYEPDYFSAVIVQLTARGRWLFPLRHSVDKDQWLSHVFKKRPIGNYYTHMLKSHRVVTTQHGTFETGSYIRDWEHEPWAFRTDTDIANDIGKHYQNWHPHDNYDNFSLQYEDLFGDTLLKLYRPHFRNFFYFTFFNSYSPKPEEYKEYHVGNIGPSKPFVQWAIDKHGEEKVVLDMFDNTWHTSQQGEDIFVNEYILPSEIGNYLRS